VVVLAGAPTGATVVTVVVPVVPVVVVIFVVTVVTMAGASEPGEDLGHLSSCGDEQWILRSTASLASTSCGSTNIRQPSCL
jgi:hypothetical protein